MSWTGRLGLVAGLVAVALATSTAFPQETACEAKAHVKSRPAPVITVPPSAPAVAAPDLAGALAAAVAARGSAMDLGLAVLDLHTGAIAASNGDQQFYSASLSKLILAVDILSGDMVSRPLTDLDRARLIRALSVSDDSAMDAMWTSHDGMGAIGRIASAAALTGTSAPRDPSQWGEVVVTASDVVRLYQHLLTSPAREFVVGALSSAGPVAADGFNQAFGLFGEGAYTKQGWMYYLPASIYLHSAGVVRDRFVIALLSVQQGVSWQTARERVNAVASTLLPPLTVSTR